MNDRRDKDLLPTERRTLWALRTTVSARILCFLSRVAELPRRQRQSLAVAFDAAACVVATWLAFALRVGAQSFYFREYLILLGVSLVCWFTIALWRGIYRSIIRFSGGRTMAAIALSGTIMMVPMSAVFLFYGIPGIPRTLGILQPVLLVMLLGGLRLAIRFALSDVLHVARGPGDIRHVMIYGAGRAGQQLALSLRHEAHVRVVGYLDDDRRLDGQRLDGVPVYCADRLEHAKTVHNIDEVLIALPKATRAQRRQIVERLQTSALSVRSLPPTAQILSGQVSLSDLRDVAVEDLLGRDPVAANPQLMDFTIVGKTVLVSGAGGSIGSELCRQIISVGPERLIIADQSEFALYAILEELKALVKKAGCTITIVPELANVADRDAVLRIYRHWRPNTVFHAAAYKHVPLVEANPIAGMTNNILGTLHSCLAAEAVGVTTFTLISSDKAAKQAEDEQEAHDLHHGAFRQRAGLEWVGCSIV